VDTVHNLQFLEFSNLIHRTDLTEDIISELFQEEKGNTADWQKNMEIIFIALPILKQYPEKLNGLLFNPNIKTAIHAAFGYLMESARTIEPDVHHVCIKSRDKMASLLGRTLLETGTEVTTESVQQLLVWIFRLKVLAKYSP